jgi:hypothetical protein
MNTEQGTEETLVPTDVEIRKLWDRISDSARQLTDMTKERDDLQQRANQMYIELMDTRDLLADANRRSDERRELQRQFGDDLAEQRAKNAVLEQQLEGKVRDLDRFKARVVEVAGEAAHEYDFCREGVNDALAKLGLELGVLKYDATVNITMNLTATMHSPRPMPDEAWVASSIPQDELAQAIKHNFSMDSEHSGWSIWSVAIDVTDVNENDG